MEHKCLNESSTDLDQAAVLGQSCVKEHVSQIYLMDCSVLQIRKGKRDNLGIIFCITPLKHML